MPLNLLAWNNKIGLRSYFVGLRAEVMIKRNSWGHSYSTVRGEFGGGHLEGHLEGHFG